MGRALRQTQYWLPSYSLKQKFDFVTNTARKNMFH
jgi:hypothetical protein